MFKSIEEHRGVKCLWCEVPEAFHHTGECKLNELRIAMSEEVVGV